VTVEPKKLAASAFCTTYQREPWRAVRNRGLETAVAVAAECSSARKIREPMSFSLNSHARICAANGAGWVDVASLTALILN